MTDQDGASAIRWPHTDPQRHVLRSAGSRDIGAVLSLWALGGGPSSVTDTADAIADLLTRDPGALLVAESGSAVVGSLIAAWDGWRGSFYKLVVHPEHRRHGIATELLREGERRLRAQGAIRLTAIVVADDPAAMAFWEAAYAQLTHSASNGYRSFQTHGCVRSIAVTEYDGKTLARARTRCL